MQLIRYITLAVLGLTSLNLHVNAQCGARVRKSWDSLTETEKTNYRGAVGAAMESKQYIKMVEMHTEMMSEREAHRQCMFIYWHRLLLIIYENMLRAQGSQYACVTIPYWDWISAHNRLTNGECSTIQDCSPIISGLGGGGSRNGQEITLNINGAETEGYCIQSNPLNHFCQSGSTPTAQCSKCVTRGDYSTVRVPGACSFASVRNMLFSAPNIGELVPQIEQSAHNNIHAVLGGAMSTFASPSDPLFWSHHAMVDLLHVIYYKCRVGTDTLSFEQKASNPIAWASCERRNGGIFNPTDRIVMRTGVNGRNPVDGSADSVIGKYFQGVPNRFADMMDVRDLGTASYTYQVNGLLGELYNNCDGKQAPTISPAVTTTRAPPVTTTRAPPVTTTRAPPVTTTRAPPVTTTKAPPVTTTTTQPSTTKAPLPTITTSQPTMPPQQPGEPEQPQCDSFFCRWIEYWKRLVDKHKHDQHPRRLTGYDDLDVSQVEGSVKAPSDEYSATPSPSTPEQQGPDSTPDQTPEPTPEPTPANSSPAEQEVEIPEEEPIQQPPVTTPKQKSLCPSGTAAAPEPSSTATPETPTEMVIVDTETIDEASTKVKDWYKDVQEKCGGDSPKSMAEVERIACMFQHECLGGTPDYSDKFKKLFGADPPRCKIIVDAILAGSESIGIEGWKDSMVETFGCPTEGKPDQQIPGELQPHSDIDANQRRKNIRS